MLKLLKALLLVPKILYRIVAGGYHYYRYLERTSYRDTDFNSMGNNCFICEEVVIRQPDRMSMGDSSYIGSRCFIDARGGFRIGRYSGIGANSTILTTEHRYVSAKTIPFDDIRMVKPVIIEDFVWIGMDVRICSGIRIGEGAIVGLGSVVTRDVPPFAIVMGNPARVIGYRDVDNFSELKNKGAIRDLMPTKSLRRYLISPSMQRKYCKELGDLGLGSVIEDDTFQETKVD